MLLRRSGIRSARDLAERAALQGVRLELPELQEGAAEEEFTPDEAAKLEREMKDAQARIQAERYSRGK
jgi:predicted nuclease with TOPRIM domain